MVSLLVVLAMTPKSAVDRLRLTLDGCCYSAKVSPLTAVVVVLTESFNLKKIKLK